MLTKERQHDGRRTVKGEVGPRSLIWKTRNWMAIAKLNSRRLTISLNKFRQLVNMATTNSWQVASVKERTKSRLEQDWQGPLHL